MVELTSKTPCAELLPLEIGGVTLEEIDPGQMTILGPFADAKMSNVLEAAHGMALPVPGRSTGKEGARCIWFGRGQALLMGPVPDAKLAKHGAVVDQSDGWAVVTLNGEGADQVLARLMPLDLRPAQFKRGHTGRTQLGHMACSVTRLGSQSFMIAVFRSMAGTMVHELKTAMAGVASRR
ncbi:sarcosine oxidase subunit gamma [Sulfitobacter sp. SK012]|uniref:sarcosine oxidase subunit gamma n=1 Tax=Sulfitobacter sp. SK012 TaxID=1389005 RepID=UPI000E0B6D3A|nr:sarcosine oxidase subunit gamma [Sulfitobacter sp. SK012]AXI45946.1 sarcosine oxidase subunit gamma [Sulfitobacter sp. SK012]